MSSYKCCNEHDTYIIEEKYTVTFIYRMKRLFKSYNNEHSAKDFQRRLKKQGYSSSLLINY